jgi:hypothetical protein
MSDYANAGIWLACFAAIAANSVAISTIDHSAGAARFVRIITISTSAIATFVAMVMALFQTVL